MNTSGFLKNSLPCCRILAMILYFNAKLQTMISWQDFSKIDLRVGTIVDAREFPEARNPSFVLEVDFGDLGIKKTSAQVTALYDTAELIGKQVIGVVNFPKKQIANVMSEFLILGAVDGKNVTLLSVDKEVSNGLKVS